MLCTVPREIVPVEEVAEQFDNPPIRAVADQDQGQDQLTQPGLGYRQVEEDIVRLGIQASKAWVRASWAVWAC